MGQWGQRLAGQCIGMKLVIPVDEYRERQRRWREKEECVNDPHIFFRLRKPTTVVGPPLIDNSYRSLKWGIHVLSDII